MTHRSYALFALVACCAFVRPSLAQNANDTQTPQHAPGLSVRVYDIEETMSEVPKLVGGQTPNVNRIAENVDLDSDRKDFGDLKENFYCHVTGWLVVQTPGEYTFRLLSDDGTLVDLDEVRLIAADGFNNGKLPHDAIIQLTAGEHPIKVMNFNGGGDAKVLLQWKKPGEDVFVTIPKEVFRTVANEVLVTSPGKKQIVSVASKMRPGDRMPLAGIHPSMNLVDIRPGGFEPRVGGMDFMSDGRLVICEWDPNGDVYILEGLEKATTEDRSMVHAKKFASGLAEPLGVTVLKEAGESDRIFVLQKQELTELIDTDNDGVADVYRCHADGWNVSDNFHEFAFGLVQTGGKFYFNLAVAINPGGSTHEPQVEGRGTVRSVDMDGNVETFATGFRTPNGIGLGPDDEIFVSDNQGDWVPASTLAAVYKGGFYGSHTVPDHKNATMNPVPPILWMPQGEIGNSPSNPVLVKEGVYKGQMFHGDVTYGGVQRDFIERVNGNWQGAIFQFTQGLEGGVNRIVFGPDGALYVGGIGSTGNWGQEGKVRYGLQKLVPNGKTAFEPLAIRAKTGGFEIEFTQPLADSAVAWNPVSYVVSSWGYQRTNTYGGPKIDEKILKVTAVSVSEDRKKVGLAVDGLEATKVVNIRVAGAVQNEAGERLWTTEGFYTLNTIPHDAPLAFVKPSAAVQAVLDRKINILSEDEKKNGFIQLFNGQSLEGWRGYKQKDAPAGWVVDDDAIHRKDGGGDLITLEQYGSFDLRLDWKVAPGSNSGIIYHIAETNGASYETGIEMQVLDNAKHADGRNPITSAGSCYAMYPPLKDVTKPAGEWNLARLVVDGKKVTHYLNDVKVCEYEIDSPDWKVRLDKSKFKDWPRYAKEASGHIGFQDHGDSVWYRNVRIKTLEK